ncbi:MAG: class I SAM-dependent methyltransferase [Ignavibacterium sp.]|nr:class I SAM-dependent methyltransferase [Ignavibacterium sp.]
MVNDIEKKLERPLKILDVGGWYHFWKNMEFDKTHHHITILNIEEIKSENQNIVCIIGDGTNMSQFNDKEFDIVFSNSVIEHLFTYENQEKMANEIRRLSNYHFVQTPSFYFPIEPHFLFPFFHWLPKKLRIWLVSNFSLGWYKRTKNKNDASKIVDEIRLLKYSELIKLFPESKIIKERFMGFTKSYIVVKFN